MAEASDSSPTEWPTARRIEAARRAGDVPRSPLFSAWFVLAAFWLVLRGLDEALFEAFAGFMRMAYGEPEAGLSRLAQMAALLWPFLALLLTIFAAASLAPLLHSGWVWAPDGRAPSVAPTVSAGVAFLAATALAVWGGLQAWQPPPDTMGLWTRLMGALGWLVGALALVALLDVGWRWWRYLRRLRMTPEDVRAEARESEMNPALRARLAGRRPVA